ncbi:unnamed protein product [Merluccius merluccius]
MSALLLCVLLLLRSASSGTDGRAAPPEEEEEDRNFPGLQDGRTDGPTGQQQQQQPPNNGLRSWRGPPCTLKVQVSDALSRRGLSRARVEVYVDYRRVATALTGADGAALLTVPRQETAPGVVVVAASKDGYVLTASPWKPHRMPIFSSITMSLLAMSKGNIWLYDDSILINGKTSDALFQPSVEFPQSLLNLSSISSDVSSLSAYFAAPVLQSGDRDAQLSITAITASTSGYTSGELRAVAAVSVQLFSGEAELQVSGDLRLSLPLEPGWGLRPGDHVPAWRFNRTAGGWMRGGLGTVDFSRGRLTWTFVAPHLGSWIAAPMSSTRGQYSLSAAVDFLFQHCLSLMAALGAALLLLLLLLAAVCCCSQTKPKAARVSRLRRSKRDQSTSTRDNEAFEVSLRDPRRDAEGLADLPAAGRSAARPRDDDSALCEENAFAAAMASSGKGNTAAGGRADRPTGFSQRGAASFSLDDGLFFCNQPLAILHAPAFFHVDEGRPLLEEEQYRPPGASGPSPGAAETTQSQSAAPSSLQSQTPTANADDPPGGQGRSDPPTAAPTAATAAAATAATAAAASTSRGHHLPESLSVPGTLNKARDKRHSCSGPFAGPDPQEAGGDPSPLPPRAWFVSLEGKPAAEIHRAVSDQHRRQRRPVESRDTSLDSGVDMSELSQAAGGRRAGVALERSVTFMKRGQQQ